MVWYAIKRNETKPKTNYNSLYAIKSTIRQTNQPTNKKATTKQYFVKQHEKGTLNDRF